MIYSVIVALASLMLSKIIEKPILQIQKDIENTLRSDHKDFTIDNPKSYSEINLIENHIKKLILYVEEQSRDAAVGNVAKQVAHDIRSPLSAMHTFVELLDSQLTEKDRIFLRNAIRRIDDIASNLVSCYKGNESSHCENAFLACCILEILAEKRREYFNVQNIFFEFEVEKKENYFAITDIDSTEFKRMLSNLINNSVKAMSSGGVIKISLHSSYLGHCVEIIDNGIGMSNDQLINLMSKSSTKEINLGLGLNHAKIFMQKMKGSIDIESQLNIGTTVTISFPRCISPKWIFKECDILNKKIIIVDDDQSCHYTWQMLIKTLGQENTLENYYSPDQFISIVSSIKDNYIVLAEPLAKLFSKWQSKITWLLLIFIKKS